MTETTPTDLRLPARPHPHDPLVAVASIPEGLPVGTDSVITDERGRRYAYASGEDFERIASTAPFSQRRFFPIGQELHVLPPDTALLRLAL